MLSTCASLYRLHTSPHQAFQCDAMLQLLPRLSCPGRLLDRFTVRSPVSLLDQGSNTGIEAEMRRIRNKLNKQPISLVHFQNHDLPKSSTIFRVEFSMLTISMAMTKFGSSDSSMSSGIQWTLYISCNLGSQSTVIDLEQSQSQAMPGHVRFEGLSCIATTGAFHEKILHFYFLRDTKTDTNWATNCWNVTSCKMLKEQSSEQMDEKQPSKDLHQDSIGRTKYNKT